jgi:hypothetical protein
MIPDSDSTGAGDDSWPLQRADGDSAGPTMIPGPSDALTVIPRAPATIPGPSNAPTVILQGPTMIPGPSDALTVIPLTPATIPKG